MKLASKRAEDNERMIGKLIDWIVELESPVTQQQYDIRPMDVPFCKSLKTGRKLKR